MRNLLVAIRTGAVLLAIVVAHSASAVEITFESPTYSEGAIAGQDGWSGSGGVVSSSLTRFGPVAGNQSVLLGPDMGRDVSSEVTSMTPFSFLWDWSPTFFGNSRFVEWDITVAGTRIARFGADLRANDTSRVYAYTVVNGSGVFNSHTFAGTNPMMQVTGLIDFTTERYHIGFTDLTTNAFYGLTDLSFITTPGLAAAQLDTDFTTTASVEGDHYIDNLSFGGPAPTSTTWASTSGDWNTKASWFPGVVPNDNTRDVVFGSGNSTPQTIFTNTPVTARNIQFGVTTDGGATQSYAIAGQGSVNLQSDTNLSTLTVIDGVHQFQSVVELHNNGVVNVGAGGVLAFNNALNLNGHSLTKSGAGVLNINNVQNSGAGGALTLAAGVVGGDGELDGSLINSGGTVAPGNSPGSLAVAGNFSQAAGGTLAIEIAGSGAGQFDLLSVNGTAALDGILDISLLSFTPTPNQSFKILTAAGGITSNSLELTGDMAGSFSLSLANANKDLMLTFVGGGGLPGDFDNNGFVNGNDFLVWQRGGSPTPLGAGDLATWKSNFGSGSSTVAAAAVPEPQSVLLLMGAAIAAACTRRSRRAV